MKIIKLVLVLIVLATLYSCETYKQEENRAIQITGVQNIEFTIGDDIPNYLEGVSATFDDGEELSDIDVNDDEVDYELSGIYYVYYYFRHDDGTSFISTISVTVKNPVLDIDYSAPYFIGVEDIKYYVGQDIPDYKADIKAYDEVDGDLTESINFEGEVDFETAGTYEFILTVNDQTGNRKIAYFTITVIDNQPPVISGYHRIYYSIGDDILDYTKYVEVSDQEDGDITELLEVIDSHVDLTLPGIYPLTYLVEDSFGNQTEQVISVQVSENDETYQVDQLDVYYINDTHGSILEFENEMGLAKIGNVVIDAYEQNPYETLFLSGGDLLQGNVLSNFYYGASMIDMFNYMQLDVFVLGNHEFDWGLEKITEYFNPNTQGMQANFPLLAANVFYKGTDIRPEHTDAYAIFNRGDIKIGVVGTIGSGLESSIAKSRVEDYEFKSPSYWTEYYTELLRKDFDVDVVFAITHGSDDYFNQKMSLNTSYQKVDAIFNGHSHSSYTTELNGVPLMQSSSNARALGHIIFDVNSEKEVSYRSMENLFSYSDVKLQIEHPGLKVLIDSYVEQIEPLLNEAILYSSQNYGRDVLTTFMAEVIRKSAGADVGIHNSGGTRDSLSQGQAITVGTTYKIFPFDNQIISVKMSGSKLLSILNNSSVSASLKPGFNRNDIVSTEYYWVATNDYVFGNYDAFKGYIDIYYPGIVDREAFEDELRERAQTTNQLIID